MIDDQVMAVLACPACHTRFELVAERWLVCQNAECGRKYPIIDDIPCLLIEEGDKYVDTPIDQLADITPKA